MVLTYNFSIIMVHSEILQIHTIEYTKRAICILYHHYGKGEIVNFLTPYLIDLLKGYP